MDGGSLSGQTTNYNIETTSFTLPTPTKTGYRFTGWTGSNGTTAQTSVTVSKGSTGNKTYTANWTPDNYNVNVTKGAGIASVSGTGSHKVGDTVTLTVTLSYSCYNFSGWSGYTTGSSTTLTFTMPAQTVNLTASTTINTNNSVHSFTTVYTKSPTCTATGTSHSECSICGYIASGTEQTVAALGHSWGTWQNTGSGYPCTTGGSRERTCTVCGESQTENTGKVDHNYEVKYYYCSVCNTNFGASLPTSTTHTRSDNGNNCSGSVFAHKECVYECGSVINANAAIVDKTKGDTNTGTFDVHATVSGTSIKSSYNDQYTTVIKVDGATATMSTGNQGGNYCSNKVNVIRNFTVDSSGLATITYIVKNLTSSNVTVGIAFHTDVMIGTNDSATIEANEYGFYMSDEGKTISGNTIKFQLYARNYTEVTNMDGWWYGQYSQRESHLWDTTSTTTKLSNTDSGFAAHWDNRIIPANGTMSFTAKIGIL